MKRPARVHVIINPASGRPQPLLHLLNEHCREIEWDVSVTSARQGSGAQLAKKALAAGTEAIAVCGGDGTVVDVAGAMLDQDRPLLILPGGTGNLVAGELGTDPDLSTAVKIFEREEWTVRRVDVGIRDGKHPFLLRCGCGLEALALEKTDREAKAANGHPSSVLVLT